VAEAAVTTREALYAKACQRVVNTLGMRYAWVGRSEPGRGWICLAEAGARLSGPCLWQHTPFLTETERTPQLFPQLTQNPRFQSLRGCLSEVESAAALPIWHQNRLDAYLWLYHADPNPFSPERVSLLQVISEDLGRVLDRIHLTDTLSRTQNELAILVDRLTRTQGLYRALAATSNVLIRATNERELLTRVCRQLAKSGIFQVAWIGRPDSAGIFRVLAAAGPGSQEIKQFRLSLDQDPGPLVVKAWRTGRLQFHNDHRQAPEMAPWKEFLTRQAWAAGAAVPILRNRRRWATLAVVSGTPNIFDHQVLNLVVQIARLIGLGLDEQDLKTRLSEEHQRQFFLARHDPLTGLANRLGLAEYLEQVIRPEVGRDSSVVVGVIDLDDFKRVNDTWGHAAGDQLLRQVADQLRRLVGPDNLVTRLGGDEFVIVLTDLEARADLDRLWTTMQSTLETVLLPDGSVYRLGLSLGLTRYPEDASDTDGLLRHADMALYLAKSQKARRSVWWQWWTPELTMRES